MKRGTGDHPKTKRLARRLQINLAWAGGILEYLWNWTAIRCPRGDIGKFSDEEIADAVHWPADRACYELILALIESGWVERHEEHRLVIHDWSEHADDTVNKWLHRRGESFWDGSLPYRKGSRKRPENPEMLHPTCNETSLHNTVSRQKADLSRPGARQNGTLSRQNGTLSRQNGTLSRLPEPEPLPEPQIYETSSARKTPDTVARAPEAPSLPAMADDDGYTALRCQIESLVPAHTYTADDWAIGYQHWLRLDPEQRQTAATNYAARVQANGDDLTYLKPQLILRGREWQRRPAPPRQNGRRAQAEAELDAMIAAAEREEAR